MILEGKETMVDILHKSYALGKKSADKLSCLVLIVIGLLLGPGFAKAADPSIYRPRRILDAEGKPIWHT